MRRGRPINRGPTRQGGSRFGLVLVLALWVAAVPLAAQEEVQVTDLDRLMNMTEEELAEAGFGGGFRVDDVPYAMRVDTLFDALVHWESADQWLSNRGLDPASPAARELRAMAREVEREHPARETPDAEIAGNLEEEIAWKKDRRAARYRALGSAFGRWLENRRSEGYPPEFFLDRIVANVATAVISTDSEEALQAELVSAAAQFEAGLREVMQSIPLQLMEVPKEDGR